MFIPDLSVACLSDPGTVDIVTDLRSDCDWQDMGAFMMMEHVKRLHGVSPTDVRYYYRASAGGVRYVAPPPKNMIFNLKGFKL